ncbi:hypothetical protein [Ideonella sp. A 288]|uniref:hypothetical protein n=1 Tax=Ideonella sp. A 288 TaxID=1962181 RepID=UPI001184D98C|nr:hypothetical protein [Ideonella sp. A 288]
MATRPPQAKSHRKPRRIPLLASEAERSAIMMRWVQEDDDQLVLLAEELGIADNPSRWYLLALALARKYEPAFREQRIPQTKWTWLTRGLLVVEVERLIADKRLAGNEKCPANPGHTATWAAGILAKRPEWKNYLHGGKDPAEALRIQYSRFHKDPRAQAGRDWFRYHLLLKTVAEWDELLHDALARD